MNLSENIAEDKQDIIYAGLNKEVGRLSRV